MLLDLAFRPKARKPVAHQEPEEPIQSLVNKNPCHLSVKLQVVIENDITIDIEPSFISELLDQLNNSADDKDESSLPHPSRLYYNYNLVYIKLMFFNVSII